MHHNHCRIRSVILWGDAKKDVPRYFESVRHGGTFARTGIVASMADGAVRTGALYHLKPERAAELSQPRCA